MDRRTFLKVTATGMTAAFANPSSLLSSSDKHNHGEIKPYLTVQKGIKKLKNEAASMRDNLEFRLTNDGAWDFWMDSKDMLLYGGKNEDGRFRFKYDHSFNLDFIANAEIKDNGAIALGKTIAENKKNYDTSEGTEFIIISQDEINGADCGYAIRKDKYDKLVKRNPGFKNKKAKIGLAVLEKAGGCKINAHYTIDEASKSDLWKEAAVRKNGATAANYAEAESFLREKYVPKAQKQGCFNDDGMGFYVNTEAKDYEVRPLCVWNRGFDSYAGGWGDFRDDGRFLRVQKSAAEGGELSDSQGYQWLQKKAKNPEAVSALLDSLSRYMKRK